MQKISPDRNESLKIGIIGTAKNTGKTTTMVAMMNEAVHRGISLGLTGIGYDGEAIDNLTFLPKPRVVLSPGVWIGTAQKCAEHATARFDILETTSEMTSLGPVQILKTLESGGVLLAGPNKTSSLKRILSRLDKHADLIMIDGALGRIVPMEDADAVIFATGAARCPDIPLLADEMKATEDIFHLPGIDAEDDVSPFPEKITVYNENGDSMIFPFSSFLEPVQVEQFWRECPEDPEKIIIPGAVSIKGMKAFHELAGERLKEVKIIFRSPPMLLAGGKPILVRDELNRLLEKGALACYHKTLPILAVTINPFYPKSAGRRGRFEAAYVDEKELKNAFLRETDLPVINIEKDGAGTLFDLISEFRPGMLPDS